MEYLFSAKLWLYAGSGAWVFVTLPKDISKEIKSLSSPYRKGFGSVRVHVRARNTTWTTSIFPDSKASAYLLPIKKEIRNNASIDVGDTVDFSLTIADLD